VPGGVGGGRGRTTHGAEHTHVEGLTRIRNGRSGIRRGAGFRFPLFPCGGRSRPNIRGEGSYHMNETRSTGSHSRSWPAPTPFESRDRTLYPTPHPAPSDGPVVEAPATSIPGTRLRSGHSTGSAPKGRTTSSRSVTAPPSSSCRPSTPLSRSQNDREKTTRDTAYRHGSASQGAGTTHCAGSTRTRIAHRCRFIGPAR